MDLNNDPLHRAALRDMLNSQTGRELRAYIAAHRPKITGPTLEARALAGAERQGWENLEAHINALAAPLQSQVEQAMLDHSRDDAPIPAGHPLAAEDES